MRSPRSLDVRLRSFWVVFVPVLPVECRRSSLECCIGGSDVNPERQGIQLDDLEIIKRLRSRLKIAVHYRFYAWISVCLRRDRYRRQTFDPVFDLAINEECGVTCFSQ